MTFERKNLGNKGEDLALKYLQKKGYFLLGRNIKFKFGEIDLFMKDGKTLVVVEVKTKSNPLFGLPQEEVDAHKKHKLILLSRTVAQKFPDTPIRIDVVAVDERLDLIDHIVNAVEE